MVGGLVVNKSHKWHIVISMPWIISTCISVKFSISLVLLMDRAACDGLGVNHELAIPFCE